MTLRSHENEGKEEWVCSGRDTRRLPLVKTLLQLQISRGWNFERETFSFHEINTQFTQ